MSNRIVLRNLESKNAAIKSGQDTGSSELEGAGEDELEDVLTRGAERDANSDLLPSDDRIAGESRFSYKERRFSNRLLFSGRRFGNRRSLLRGVTSEGYRFGFFSGRARTRPNCLTWWSSGPGVRQ